MLDLGMIDGCMACGTWVWGWFWNIYDTLPCDRAGEKLAFLLIRAYNSIISHAEHV